MQGPPLIFALTGGIGSGKSTVGEFFRQAGVPVVDADQLARSTTDLGSPLLPLLAERFGPEVLRPDGSLDRPALAQLVFSSDSARAALEALIHPEVRRRAERAFAELRAQGHELICYEIPLLFETNQEERFRPVVVVHVPEVAQLARTMSRDGMSEDDARARIVAQLDLGDKAAQADYVIDNTGTKEETQRQAQRVLDQIRSRRALD